MNLESHRKAEKLIEINKLIKEYEEMTNSKNRLALCFELMEKEENESLLTQSEQSIVDVAITPTKVLKNRFGKQGRILTDEDIERIEKNAIIQYKLDEKIKELDKE